MRARDQACALIGDGDGWSVAYPRINDGDTLQDIMDWCASRPVPCTCLPCISSSICHTLSQALVQPLSPSPSLAEKLWWALRSICRARSRMPLDTLLRIAKQLLLALTDLQTFDVVHLDIVRPRVPDLTGWLLWVTRMTPALDSGTSCIATQHRHNLGLFK